MAPKMDAETPRADTDRDALFQALLADRDAMTPRALEDAIADERVPRIIAALERDGLVERRAGRIGLPR